MDDNSIMNLFNSFKKENGSFNAMLIKRFNFINNYPKQYDYLLNRFKDISKETKLTEILYRIENHIERIPECPVCGKPVSFINYKNGYRKFCSLKCRNSSEGSELVGNEISKSISQQTIEKRQKAIEKRKETNLSKYGVEFTGQSPEFKEKAKQTCLKRYNVEYTSQADIKKIHTKETFAKHPEKLKAKYEHMKETCLKKYGSDQFFKTDIFKEKSVITKKKSKEFKWKEKGLDIEYLPGMNVLIHNCCDKHGDIKMSLSMLYNRFPNLVLCPICNPIDKGPTSSEEIEIKQFLDSNNISYKLHDRSILGNKFELDFYIPDHKLAIECNGIYWHSDLFKPNDYHQKKAIECESKGIKLLQFWEDDYRSNKVKMFDILKTSLNIIPKQNKIYARKCIVKEITAKESREFINQNHLQGNVNASVKLGLFFNSRLVSVMTFGKYRKALGKKSEQDCYELYRFCSLNGYEVSGAAGKLLAYFKKNYKWHKIISYAKYDISQGKLYKKIGFDYKGLTKPNYFWVNRNNFIRENRFKYRKDKIVNESNKNMTEEEIMYKNSFFKCYDSGSKRYEMTNNEYKE